VTVTLVDGAAGPVDIDGSNGAVSLEVGAGFAGELTATTVNGSVKVDAPASVTRKDVKPASARLRFKVSGEPSTIKTTNASVAIRVGAGEGE
jgi:DUF4097 and DUF4098 domain-containing protein YvlB